MMSPFPLLFVASYEEKNVDSFISSPVAFNEEDGEDVKGRKRLRSSVKNGVKKKPKIANEVMEETASSAALATA